ncbi:MAG: hypothetical protein RL728_899 [Bacteroidota bacterium]|jgi:hypothetical protein
MPNTYITKELIANESLSELDFELRNKFNFEYDDLDSQFFEINKGGYGYANAEPIEIDVLIDILSSLKNKGATHVQIEDHCDHQGYDVSGFNIKNSTQEEIDEYDKNLKIEKEKRNKLLELQRQIQEITG